MLRLTHHVLELERSICRQMLLFEIDRRGEMYLPKFPLDLLPKYRSRHLMNENVLHSSSRYLNDLVR